MSRKGSEMQPVALPSQVLGPDGRRYWAYADRRVPIMAGAEDPPADPPADPPKSGDPPKGSDKGGDKGGGDDDDFDKERALATIRKLRETEKVSKQQTKELDELRAKVKEADDAKLSETEKLQARLTELERQHTDTQQSLRQERARNAVLVTAQRLGAVDADVVYRLVRDDLEFDAQDQPQDVEPAIKALLKDRPYLTRGNGSADGGAGQNGRQSGGLDMNAQIRRLAGRA